MAVEILSEKMKYKMHQKNVIEKQNRNYKQKVFKRKNSDKARCVTNAGPTRIGIIFAAKFPVEIAVVIAVDFPVENCSRDCSRTRNNHRAKQL